MKNETHEDRVKILKGAPKGKTFYNGEYISELDVDLVNITDCFDVTGLRSLSDIQQLVDKKNEVNKWHDAYLVAMNEFDKKCKALNKVSSQCRDMQNEIDRLKQAQSALITLNRNAKFKLFLAENPDVSKEVKGTLIND